MESNVGLLEKEILLARSVRMHSNGALVSHHRLSLALAPSLYLVDHLFLHLIDVDLLFLETFCGQSDVLLQVVELFNAQVAIFSLLLELLVLYLLPLLLLLDSLLQVLLVLLHLKELRIALSRALFLEHLVDHVGDIAWCVPLLDHRPLLHDSVLKLDTKRVHA